MNILVLNLTRFGDLLQSAAAVRALAMSGGEKNRIGIVCLDNFIAGAELLPEITDIYPIPGGAIVSAIGEAAKNPGVSWMGSLSRLRDWVASVIEDFRPDLVCNLSPTTATPRLGKLLANDKELRGFSLDAQGLFRNTTPWADFIQGSSASRGTSPFNIVDLFRRTAGDVSITPDASLSPPPKEAVTAMEQRLRAVSPEGTAGFLALQLGASADIRCWPAASFAAVGDALWEKFRLLPLLLGTKSERPLAEKYAAKATAPFHSLTGETNLTELAAALLASSLCISNDTGTLHLASGLNVPVIGIYLATAQPWDTGPYAPGNCSLEPDLACHPCGFNTRCPHNLACHAAITPEAVVALAAAKIAAPVRPKENFAPQEALRGSRVWQSARDTFGFADLISLSKHEDTERTRWMRLQRHLYRQFFDRDARQPFTPAPFTAASAGGGQNTARRQSCAEIVTLFDALLLQGEMLLEKPLPQVRDRFQRTWQRLSQFLNAQPDFAAISFIWKNEAFAADDFQQTFSLMRQYRELFVALRNAFE